MPEMREITSGLQFPEGPVALDDGSVLVVEIKRGTLTRVAPDGRQTIVAPTGGFCATAHGNMRERDRDRTGVFYARADGSRIREVIFPLDAPNGIGLSPDGRRLYVAETWTGRVWYWELAGPGEIVAAPGFGPGGGTLLAGLPGFQLFDSLGVDGAGNVCVATLVTGAITVISPGGEVIEQVPTGDPLTTNICFGGRGLRTAYITASGTGRLLAAEWPPPGLRLEYP